MINLASKKILLTGGTGFLGKHLHKKLECENAEVISIGRTPYDLTNTEGAARCFEEIKPDIVVHLAAHIGGINFNRLYPADVFLKNLQMACNIFEQSHKHKVEKLVNIGSACVYSDQLGRPMQETDVMQYPMHPSVQYYGFSKLALYLGGLAYHSQYNFNSIHLIPANLYGPEDKFDPELSHVVSSMIPKFVHAAKTQAPEVVCWGSGNTVREFLYIDDCADAIILAMKSYSSPEPLNIGQGEGVKIRDLAKAIAKAADFRGETVWDSSIPDGSAYKVVDSARARKALNWEPKMTTEEGIKKTVDWFCKHYSNWTDGELSFS